MKSQLLLIFATCSSIVFSGCAKSLHTGTGGYADLSLNRNSDEYSIKRLKTIQLDGNAIFGIPGFSGNNKNNNKSGMIFKFNGIELGRTPRLLPILTLLGTTFGYGTLLFSVIDKPSIINNYNSRGLYRGLSYVGAIPFAGITNNLIWSGAATSGLTNQLYFKLVDENPDIDVFLNPKYKMDYKLGLFSQKATVVANVTGATLIMK